MTLDAKRDLANYERWSTVAKMLSGAFLAALVMSIVSATYEYYTMQQRWLFPASVALDVAVVFSAALAIALNMQFRRKKTAVDSLKKAVATE